MRFRFSNTSITTQFGVLFTLVFIVPVTSLGIFFYLEFYQIQEENLEELTYVAGLQKSQIESLVNAQTQTLFALYQDEEIRDAVTQGDTQALRTLLGEKKEATSVRSITLVDHSGNLFISSQPEADALWKQSSAFVLAQTGFGLHDTFTHDGILIGVLSGPYEIPHTFSGVLLVEVDLSAITSLQVAFQQLSQTGELNLVRAMDEKVELLTLPRFGTGMETLALSASERVEVRALNKTPGSYRDVLDYHGERVFAATTYLSSSDWGLVVKKDRAEVLVPVVNLYQVVFLAVATSLLLVFLIGWYLRRYILFPIQELTKTAQKIQRGTYHGELTIGTTNEIGSLARAFKTMSEELLEANKTLEQRVKHRTSRLRKALHEARRLKTRDDALLSSIVEGMVATDVHGEIILMNAAVCNMLGCTLKDRIGTPLVHLLRLRSPKGHALEKGKGPVASVLKDRRVLRRVEYQARRKNGETFPLQLSASPVVIDGTCIGAIFTLHDITKEKEVDRMKSEFITIASHQLRAPLASMKWYGELLAKGKAGKLGREQQEFVDRLNTSTHRTISLVDDFLNASRLEKGEWRNEPKRVQIHELLEGILLTLTPETQDKQLEVIVQDTSKKKTMRVDPDMLREVLVNLIGNAMKYSKSHGKVMIKISQSGSRLRWEIVDYGIGIPKGEQGHLFEKFYRGSNAAKLGFEGTGLGLYTVKRLVERLGGTIGCKSEEGNGSTFWVEL
jgi:PAS domain S-box-containing protein